MKALNVVWLFAFALAVAAPVSAQRTLFVNASTGSDTVAKANNSASLPWRTIGRAAWGSTNRSVPNSSEAASAGDTVVVAGGTYTTTVQVNSRWAPVYNPVNSGTSASPITFRCDGDCVLGAPNADAPAIGADGKDYIRWYADVSQGHSWQITAFGLQSGSASATQVNTSPDTGPVVCHIATGCWIEGAEIDGGQQVDYTDNWNGIRLDNAPSFTLRNNTIRNFRNQSNSLNGTGITFYGSPNGLVEHNHFANMGSALMFKDQEYTLLQSEIHVRFNLIDGADRCFVFSLTGEDRNYLYQNLCLNGNAGYAVTGGGPSNDWVFNNTFYNVRYGVTWRSHLGRGGRFWNNIVVNGAHVAWTDSGVTMPPAAVLSLEHNVYFGYAVFYSASDGSRSFSDFRNAYTDQERASPASVEADPLFVSAATRNFRLCTAAGVPAASCGGPSPALGRGVDLLDLDGDGSTVDTIPSGAYLTGYEVIGPRTAGDPTPPPSAPPASPTGVRIM